MREIKFRAWDGEKYIDNFVFSNGLWFNNGRAYEDYIDNKSLVIEQYSGVEDKVGVEIYEGDIVYSKQWKPDKMEVVFNRGGFCLKEGDESCYYPDIKYSEDMVVIGNIHKENV